MRTETCPGGLSKLTDWTDFPIQSGSLTTDGKRLVFVRSFIQRDVYVADIDADRSHMGPPRRLTMDLGDDYPTAWMRDSKTVILNSDRNGPIHIFRQDLDKPTADLISVEPGPQILSRVTPDGKSILYCSIVPVQHVCRLTRARLAGGTPVLLDVLSNIADLRCSTAGPCVIAQMQGIDSGNIVFQMDSMKGKGREIYRDADRHIAAPDISPDGKWLASPVGKKIISAPFQPERWSAKLRSAELRICIPFTILRTAKDSSRANRHPLRLGSSTSILRARQPCFGVKPAITWFGRSHRQTASIWRW